MMGCSPSNSVTQTNLHELDTSQEGTEWTKEIKTIPHTYATSQPNLDSPSWRLLPDDSSVYDVDS